MWNGCSGRYHYVTRTLKYAWTVITADNMLSIKVYQSTNDLTKNKGRVYAKMIQCILYPYITRTVKIHCELQVT